MSIGWRALGKTVTALVVGAGLASLAIAAPASSDKPAASIETARGMIEAEQFEQAVAVLKRIAAEGEPAAAEISLLFGRIYLALGKPAKALEYFEKASFASLDSEGEAYLGQAEAHLGLGDLAKARANATRAIRSDPDLVAAHLVLARIDLRLGQPGAALERLNKLQQERPESEDVAIVLSRYRALEGGPAAALPDLERFVAQWPKAAGVHDVLGHFLWAAGRQPEAVGARVTARRLYADRGQTGRAEAMAAWLKAVDPKASSAAAKLGSNHLHMKPGRPVKAPEPPPPQARPRPPVEAVPLPPPVRKAIKAAVLSRPEPLPFAPGTPVMTGSGIVLQGGRQIITNRHVIEGMRTIAVRNGTGYVRTARVVRVSQEDDLALLELDSPFPEGAAMPLSEIVEPAPGRSAIVMGYPLIGLLGDEQPALTEGIVAKSAGIANDPHTFQLTAKLNKGNSGGPIFDRRGRLLGVAVGKMNTAEIMQQSGSLPEDMNFGIKGGRVLHFLGKPPTPEKAAGPEMTLEDLYQQMLPRAVLVAAQK